MGFDTLFERCEVSRTYVLLDQTQAQCAREHECPVHRCALERFFESAVSGVPLLLAKPPAVGRRSRYKAASS